MNLRVIASLVMPPLGALSASLLFGGAAVVGTPPVAASELGSADAKTGGRIVVGLPGYPKTLLYYSAFDEFALAVSDLVLEPLAEAHPDTLALLPRLAKSWTVSKDNKVFTFVLDERAKWSDGKPVTADDVVFTWNAIHDPKNRAVPMQAYLRSIESCLAKDKQTIEFKVRTLHFDNLRKVAGIYVLPKHAVEGKDFTKDFQRTILGSGPYRIGEVRPNERIRFDRSKDWWGRVLAHNAKRFNFDTVVFRAVPDYNVQYELFKKGEIDYFYFLTAKMWATETDGPLYRNGYVKKIKAENLQPYATQGIVWNLRRPLFQDKRVRKALSHLFDRERLIKELFYDNYVLATGVVPARSEWHAPENKPVLFDPKAAVKLLTEAGFDKTDSDGVRYRIVDGKKQRFEFEILADNPASSRHLTIFQEDLKRAGIRMHIRIVDWATRMKLVDDWQFDATESARGRAVEPADFAVAWSSREADVKGSANSSGYKNPEVDKLAEEIDRTFDRKKRIELVRRLDAILGEDQPMSFAWEATFFRIAHWDRFGMPGKGYANYSSWRDAFHTWWFDEARSKRLDEARKAGQPFGG
jgi:microcin C transport system substrate-binding protein